MVFYFRDLSRVPATFVWSGVIQASLGQGLIALYCAIVIREAALPPVSGARSVFVPAISLPLDCMHKCRMCDLQSLGPLQVGRDEDGLHCCAADATHAHNSQ